MVEVVWFGLITFTDLKVDPISICKIDPLESIILLKRCVRNLSWLLNRCYNVLKAEDGLSLI